LLTLANIFLDRFFEKGFSAEKRPSTFELWRVSVDGLEKSIKGINPFKAAFYFLSYLPGKINK